MVDKFKAEADENMLSVNEDMAENKFLDAVTKGKLAAVLNYAGFGFGDRITTMQLFIKESYEYDRNGNRIKTVTKNGAIDYNYDEENRLVSSGSNGRVCVKYTYDRNGNMLAGESGMKSEKYSYSSRNWLCSSQIIDKREKTQSESRYAYDAFGRRILVQDRDEACMKSIYDGFTFDIIKQSPTFANGMFTDSNELGLRISRTGRPTGDRYRYLEDDKNDGNRYYNIDDGNYKTVSNRYVGERTLINVNGVAAAQNADGNISYFTADLLGSVRATTDSSGFETDTYTYDAFGSLVQGDLSGAKDLGYLGKQFDKATGLYNYGYRDYKPDVARFTTVDPIRDGTNWFVYCDGDSVNFVDLWGLAPRNMSQEDREAYMNTISGYQDYVNNANEMGIPDNYDCVDTMTYLYGQGTSATSLGNLSRNLTHDGNPIGLDIGNIQSRDFFSTQTNNITFYSNKDFNNSNVEIGTVLVWQGPGANGGTGWIGHTATVADVTRDNNGNVTNIKIIQGHTGGNQTGVVDIPNQAELDSYVGTFLGFGELGKNSITPLNNSTAIFKNK